MSKRKPYDYVAKLYALTAREYVDDGRAKEILRKLVREAVKTAYADAWGPDEMKDFTGVAPWDRIAKELVP
jgi:hypothetical protein